MSDPVSVVIEETVINATVSDASPIKGGSISGSGPEGPVGQEGPPGPTGPPGPPSNVQPFEYVQSVAATNWTVPHNLNRRPVSITVYDSSDFEIETGVNVIDLNTIEITMVIPTAGRVEVI